MDKIKSLYEAPTTEILVLCSEGMVCTSPNPGKAGGNLGTGNSWNFGDDD